MQRFDLQAFLNAALLEDIGAGDITSEMVVDPKATCQFSVRARQELVLAGVDLLTVLYGMVDEGVRVTLQAQDGDLVQAGAVLATLEGPARSLLLGERVALNLLQHLSGIATLTARYVDAVAGTGARIVDTRKTIPGLRTLQKYAVRMGGGYNHRLSLQDGILIKDNHIALAGGVKNALEYAKALAPQLMKIEVECDTLAQVEEALAGGADIVLLDNMDVATLSEAVRRAKAQHVATEASGNVTLETVRAIAQTGVDSISIGRLTHSVMAVDIGLDAV